MIGNDPLGFSFSHLHGSPASPAPMLGVRNILAAASVCLLLAGCGQSGNAPSAATAKSNVTVTIDGARHTCVVALPSEPQGSTIPCDDVVPFLRDELRVPSGSIYDVLTIANVDEAAVAKLQARLNDAGYRFIGGPHTMAGAEKRP